MSLLKAINNFGEVVHAKEAKSDTRYKCIHCSANIYRKVSTLNNPFFACYPGEEHTEQACRHLVRHTAHAVSEPTVFFNSLLSPSKKKKDALKPPISPINEIDPPTPPGAIGGLKPEIDNEEGVERPFTSLNQVWMERLDKTTNPDDLIGPLNASDIFIFQKWFGLCFQENTFEGGLRIIQARPDKVLWKEKKIQFLCFWKANNTADWNRVFFHVLFEHDDDFFPLAKSMFEKKETEAGSLNWERIYSWALIAGNWVKCRESIKTKNGAYELFQCKFTNKKQIYGCSNTP